MWKALKELVPLLVISAVVGAFGYYSNYKATGNGFSTESRKASVQSVDPELQAIADNLGINTGGVSIQYVGSYPDPEQKGEFNQPNKITIKRNSEQIPNTLAHEYIHYRWDRLDENHKDYLVRLVNIHYLEHPAVQARMDSYRINLTPGTSEFAEELFAIYCTEVNDSRLTPDLITNCNRIIDRSKLTFLW